MVRELRTLAAEQVLVVLRLDRVDRVGKCVGGAHCAGPGRYLTLPGAGMLRMDYVEPKAKACFLSTKTSIFTDGERELALLPSSGGVAPPYRLSGAPADAHVRNLITTESSLAYRFHQAAPLAQEKGFI
jgi:hypothetical protein